MGERHAVLLIKKYLQAYRIRNEQGQNEIAPFTEKAIKLIGESSEYNAASILKFAHHILDEAAKEKKESIDDMYVKDFKDSKDFEIESTPKDIVSTKTVDLNKKAKAKKK